MTIAALVIAGAGVLLIIFSRQLAHFWPKRGSEPRSPAIPFATGVVWIAVAAYLQFAIAPGSE